MIDELTIPSLIKKYEDKFAKDKEIAQSIFDYKGNDIAKIGTHGRLIVETVAREELTKEILQDLKELKERFDKLASIICTTNGEFMDSNSRQTLQYIVNEIDKFIGKE